MPRSLDLVQQALRNQQQDHDWAGLTVDRIGMVWHILVDDQGGNRVLTVDDVTGNRVTWSRDEFLSRKLTPIEDDTEDVYPDETTPTA